jgi:hypothetical protein
MVMDSFLLKWGYLSKRILSGNGTNASLLHWSKFLNLKLNEKLTGG